MLTATEALARTVHRTTYDDLPDAVVAEAKARIADVIGIGLSGAHGHAAGIAGLAHRWGGPGAATIWGTNLRTTAPYAALANGATVFSLELDDVHRTSHTHPGVSTIPAAVALCETRGLGGRDLIAATVLGYDACIRVGLAVSPSIYVDRTFLAPGTLGAFGAAAVAARLLGLDEAATAGALGVVAYTGPTACFESFRLGAPVKDVILGWDNLCGIRGAELAAHGYLGPATAIDGDYGFCRTTSAEFDLTRLRDGLGTRFEIVNTGVKPYACCRQHHAAIDCMLELRAAHGFALDDVAHVKVRTFAVSSRGNQTAPTSVPEAKYSIPYILAVTLRDGSAWREQFAPETIADPGLLGFAARVEVVADPELDALYDEKWPAIVEVTLRDGRTLSARRDLPKGEPEFPCSPDEVKRKFMSLAVDAVSAERAEEVWTAIAGLEDLADVRALTRLIATDPC